MTKVKLTVLYVNTRTKNMLVREFHGVFSAIQLRYQTVSLHHYQFITFY